MKIPTQIWIFCVGIFLQHYTFLQKRTFCILCEKFFHFVRKATTDSLLSVCVKQNLKKQAVAVVNGNAKNIGNALRCL